MVVGEASIHNIMGGMESTGGVRLHNHKRKLKQRFDIIKKLGQGTYGKVQLGINKETGQEVAIKTIKKCKIETEADLIRIRREIQIMSSVQHPNIIHIYEVFENREKMVLVMEYAAGGELYDYLSERKVLTEQEARRIFRQIATAVFYCHKHKICHRDLKLENILLDQVGNAKIADFGLSNVFDEQRLLNTFCGSPLYASPEIVKGTPYHGPEVDCWSLGVLLYTLVYGAMPFDGSNFKRLVKQISQSYYFEPRKPSPASPLIKDMLTACPGKRADIERICSHWWVNEGYEQNCLDIAEELAAQTPVRLDLLLSLVPQSASAEKLVVGDQQAAGDVANSMSSETLVPTRCHSVGSLMELDQNNSDRRIRELLEEDPRVAAGGDAKRKLETTPSMDETAAAGVKRKERSRKKERSQEEREPRPYRSSSRHHSAPIPNSITEEAMEVDPAVTVPTTKTADLNKVESTATCLELIQECNERSPSKERSKTPVVAGQQELLADAPVEAARKDYAEDRDERSEERLLDERTKSFDRSFHDDSLKPSDSIKTAHDLANDATPGNRSIATTPKSEAPSVMETNDRVGKEISASEEGINLEATQREFKKLKEKALSLDSDLCNEARDVPAKTFERRRSKIFETAEKFNQMAANVENEKPKKIFIPGVNVDGAKRVFERKASLSSITTPPPAKPSASKVIIDVPTEKKSDKSKQTPEEDEKKRDEAKKRAVDIITGAIAKPPVQRRVNGSPPSSPQSHEPKKLPLKIPVGNNDLRTATVSVTTPVETNFSFEDKVANTDKQRASTNNDADYEDCDDEDSQPEEPKMSSKMEITLKSATLPRPRKTSKAEISLVGVKSAEPLSFRSEVEAKIDAFQPQKLRTQRSEVAFPVAAAVPQANRSSSLEPEGRPKMAPKERIIPIQVEEDNQQSQHASTPPPKPPMPQRSLSQRSGSLSRQSTADSDTDSALGSTVGPEPIRKSPREYIIPIAVEGGGYVTPRSGSVEPESKTSTPTSTSAPRSRFGRPRRMSSLLSNTSEDESPFSSLHRDSEDLLQRHMHRLRSSRPSRQPPEHADSLSSGEDDDDDGFELLTAENLFSTLLSRVRSLTQRLNVDDNRGTGFPSSRLFGRLGSNPQAFWGLNKPLSSYQTCVETRTVTTRLTESQFRHSLSREGDMFSRKDSANSSNPGTPNSPGSHSGSTPTRETVFDIGSNTLPRDKIEHEDVEADPAGRKEARESLEQSFTPSLARRLSRTLVEQSRQSLPYEKRYRSPSREALSLLDTSEAGDRSTISDQTEYKQQSDNRSIRRANSLLEPSSKDRTRRSPRRSVSLFDDDEMDFDVDIDDNRSLPLYPGHIMTLGRKYKEPGKSGTGKLRRENFHSYRTDKIQEEGIEDHLDNNGTENGSTSECTSVSIGDSNTNLQDMTSSLSVKSYETSPTESSSVDYKSAYGSTSSRSELSKNFENRLLAAENLIKESKLKNLGPGKFNPNLSSSYRDTDKCEKQSLISAADSGSSVISKRRSCIPSLRLRSGSLTREPSLSDRRKSYADSQDSSLSIRSVSPEKSLLSKFFKTGSRDSDSKEKPQKSKQHRISRFLRPDFFDTPREESQYVKEKEAQKAAENERRKSRFMKRKSENKTQENAVEQEKRDKELKNEINALRKDRREEPLEEKMKREPEESHETKIERQGSRNSFLHSLEKKLEKLRSGEDTKPVANGGIVEPLREHSAPPAECLSPNCESIKKAVSVENLSPKKQEQTKSRVSSVLGLFKSTDAKQAANGGRAQNAILSRLKRSPPKSTKTDTNTEDVAPSSASRIPTKLSKSDSKSTKKLGETKKPSVEKIESPKRSPSKEKQKLDKTLTAKERRASYEKELKETKEPEKIVSTVTNEVGTKMSEQVDSREKVNEGKAILEDSTEKKIESVASDGVEKKLLKTKKNRSLAESSSASEAKREDAEKKKKAVKPKEGSENNEADATKKKKIVRVVKKVVKKSSDSSESKTEDKAKPIKTQIKKKTGTSTEKSPEPNGSLVMKNTRGKENGVDSTTSRSSTRSSYGEKSKIETAQEDEQKTTVKPLKKINTGKSGEEISAETKNGQAKLTESQRANRSNLKLDLSKIPQHSFRNTTPKKDSPKSESPKVSTESPKAIKEDMPDKLMDCLSKVTHRASITGNKIIIDKPLRAKDVAELKREVTECARIIESHVESSNNEIVQTPAENPPKDPPKEIQENLQKNPVERATSITPVDRPSSTETKRPKGSPVDYTNDLFSPMDEPESFDSWSLSSAELNHARPDLHSPTSPSHALFSRSDTSDSVIDRIRRRSFYSRFNDRRRPSLTAPPPGISLSASTTLPRKFSFSGHRENRDRSKYGTGYGLSTVSKTRHGDRGYNLYDEGLSRNRSLERPRYSDATASVPYISDLKSPSEHLPPLSSSYDPLRRYLRSPTFDLSASRSRYHSVDFGVDGDLGSYRTPLSSLLSDTVDSYPVASSTLPRKYGSTHAEPKSVEYYEELLAPSSSDYLPVRRSPISSEYLNRCENGYHNGNLELHLGGSKRRGYPESVGSVDLAEESDEQTSDQRRRSKSETKHLPSTSTEAACTGADYS
ncbi:nuak family kinase 1 [Calliopsis andreniformis]|uniref:nuak family kinase 1 n=1 Tax=Calliopsis andreniformis TaxID=337506 RepID=UPI003FCCAAEC